MRVIAWTALKPGLADVLPYQSVSPLQPHPTLLVPVPDHVADFRYPPATTVARQPRALYYALPAPEPCICDSDGRGRAPCCCSLPSAGATYNQWRQKTEKARW